MIHQYGIAIMTLVVPSLFGVFLLAWANILREKISIFAVGSIFGIAVFGTITYIFGHIMPLTSRVLGIELVFFAVVAAYLAWVGGIQKIVRVRTDNIALVLLCIFFVLFSIIGDKLLIEQKDTGLFTGIINAYGDIGWHAGIIMEIAERKTLPLEDPVFASHTLTYPFLANLISASMVILGASLSASVNIPATILIPILLILIYFFAKRYAASRTAGIIATLLFLFGGATFGFLRLPEDALKYNGTLGEFLLHLPARDYSGVGTDIDGFHFLNPITSLLLPQRAMLFGLPIVLSGILLLHPTVFRRPYAPAIAGSMAGMLPLFHAHACIALAGALLTMFIISPYKKRFLLFAAPALAIGIPEISFYMGGTAYEGSFFRYGPGWMVGDRNIILYWLQNTGFLIPVSIIALFLKTPRETKALVISGTALFLLANTFLFAPWAWDNFKLFVFWLLFILPAVGYIAAFVLHTSRSAVLATIVVLAIFIHMFSAGLDIWKLALPTAQIWNEWTPDAVTMASLITQYTKNTFPILTAPVHNSPATLAGRTLFLGYPAHIWSHGKIPWDREREVKEYFAGKQDTIEGVHPQYILIGPQEKSTYIRLTIRPQWQEIISHGPYTLFSSH